MINKFFAFFLPSIIGNIKFNQIFGQRKTKQNMIEQYLLITLFTNLISYFITIYIFKQPQFEFTNLFTFKYTFLSIIISYLIPFFVKIINDNVKLKVEIKTDDKKD